MAGARSPRSLSRSAFFCEGEQRFGRLFSDQGQVDAFSAERALVGPAEKQQRFGEFDRSRVDGVEAFDELGVVAVQILRATSRSVWVIASGVRSSCEALAANRRCSASWASSRASMVSNASASSRNSSWRPSSRTRWESDPLAAMRVASVMSQRAEHAAREESSLLRDQRRAGTPIPPPLAERKRLGGRTVGTNGPRLMTTASGTYRSRNTHTTARRRAREHEEPGVTQRSASGGHSALAP